MESRNCIPGLIVKLNDRDPLFKLGVILQWSDRKPDKVRVCVWSANQKAWSAPQLYDPFYLTSLAEGDLHGRRGSVVRGALENLQKHSRVDYAVRGVLQSWPLQRPTTDPPVWRSAS